MSRGSGTAAAVTLRIRHGWLVVLGIATLVGALVTVQNIYGADWFGAGLFALLTASLGFQTLQGIGALTVDAEGLADDRAFGAGEVGWEDVVRVRTGEGGWLRPPVTFEIASRARPVVAASTWSLSIEVGGDGADWEQARRHIERHARAAGVEIAGH